MEKGRQLGKYRLERLLGTGGMGAVWEAHDGDLDRNVALKVLRPGLAGDEVAQVRLLREARAMARLRHPNVITVYDATTADGLDLVAMELIDGATMAQWLATPRKRGAIVDALLAAGRGLAAAHAAGMVHRDFKPHNVLVEHTGRVLVTDFGLARASGEAPEPGARAAPPVDPREALADTVAPASAPAALDATMSLPDRRTPALDATVDAGTTPISTRTGDRGSLDTPLTQTGAVLGTPAYMAPEQFAGKAADARADQFAFCVSAWEALAGTRPFAGGSFAELAAAHGKPLIAADVLPRRLRAILTRGLAHDPAARWPTMSELLDALERAWHRPRRIASLGGVTIAFAGAIALFISMRGPSASHAPAPAKPPACPAGRDEIGKVWTPVLRATVARELGASGTAGVALIDRWAATWSGIYDANCAHPDDPDFSARRACLEAQRDDVGSMLGMAVPEGTHVELARVLPSADSCQRAPRSIAPPRPTDPAKREAVVAIERELANLRMTAKHGKHPDLGRLAELIARAHDLGFPPIYTEALYTKALLAEIAAPRGGPDRRRAALDAIDRYDAAANAAEAAGHDRVRADALLGELELSAGLPDRLNRIDTVIDRAGGAVARLGDPANDLILDALRGEIAAARGDWTHAIELADKTIAGWLERGATDTVARLALFDADLRELRHAGTDLADARALADKLGRLDLDPAIRAALASRAGYLAWRGGDLVAARASITDNALAGGGDPHGGTIRGTVTGLAPATLDDAAAERRTSLPTIIVARAPAREGVEPWRIPAGDGAWTFEHVPPGHYTVAAFVDSALGDRHTVRAAVDVVAGGTAAVTFDLAGAGIATVAFAPRVAGVVVLVPEAGPLATSAAVRARLASAAWGATTALSNRGREGATDAWTAIAWRGAGPATACLLPGAEIDGDEITPGASDPAPLCKDVP